MSGRKTASIADLAALEGYAARAGAAMACAYWSSDEFHAALIAERRAAGIYGPKRHRQWIATAAGLVAGLAVLVLLIV